MIEECDPFVVDLGEVLQEASDTCLGVRKRVANWEGDEEEEEPVGETRFHIFPEFRLSHNRWCVLYTVAEIGLFYQHERTGRPLLICGADFEGGSTLGNHRGYNIFFRDRFTKEGYIAKIFLPIDGYSADEIQSIVDDELWKIEKQYLLEGVLSLDSLCVDSGDFLAKLGLSSTVRHRVKAKRRVQPEPEQEDMIIS